MGFVFGSKMVAAQIRAMRARNKDDATIALRLNLPISRVLEIEKRHPGAKPAAGKIACAGESPARIAPGQSEDSGS